MDVREGVVEVMDKLTTTAIRQKERKPIKYWQAWQFGRIVDENNSIALLRNKWGSGAQYRSVR